MIQEKLKLNFGGGCIFDHFEIPKNDDWIFKMKKKRDKELEENIKWISDLIDKYSI